MQLKKLEEYLGVQLFERTNKQVMVTPVGESIAQRARHILREAEELKAVAKKSAQDLICGRIPARCISYACALFSAAGGSYEPSARTAAEGKTHSR